MTSFRPDPELAALLLKMRVSIRKEFGVTLDIYAADAITQFMSYGLKFKEAALVDSAEELRLRFPDTKVIANIHEQRSDKLVQSKSERLYRGTTVASPLSQDPSEYPENTDADRAIGKSDQKKQRFYRGNPLK